MLKKSVALEFTKVKKYQNLCFVSQSAGSIPTLRLENKIFHWNFDQGRQQKVQWYYDISSEKVVEQIHRT